jgi:hypothetical protein
MQPAGVGDCSGIIPAGGPNSLPLGAFSMPKGANHGCKEQRGEADLHRRSLLRRTEHSQTRSVGHGGWRVWVARWRVETS